MILSKQIATGVQSFLNQFVWKKILFAALGSHLSCLFTAALQPQSLGGRNGFQDKPIWSGMYWNNLFMYLLCWLCCYCPHDRWLNVLQVSGSIVYLQYFLVTCGAVLKWLILSILACCNSNVLVVCSVMYQLYSA